jgi:cytochrome c oxidase cbb3-type subunit 2/cytochrome c oxidase cbb3-type subunit I/II
MSDLLTAAASSLGVPEQLIERAAQARASVSGMSVDDVLAAWSGGGSVPTAPPAEAPAETVEEPAADAPPPEAPPAAEPAPAPALAEPMAAPVLGPRVTTDGRPPVLVGASDRPMTVVVASIGLFLAMVLVGFIGPSTPVDHPGARSSDIPLSAAAIDGQTIYNSLGCGSCHTQMVRPIVSDVGLGAVSLSDSNQIIGTRRFGPDLSDVGARKTGTEMQAIVEGLGGHANFNLSDADMNALIAYLLESKTSVPE